MNPAFELTVTNDEGLAHTEVFDSEEFAGMTLGEIEAHVLDEMSLAHGLEWEIDDFDGFMGDIASALGL